MTMKMRKGIDDDHLTYLDAGRIAVEEGVTAIALHGRTAAQHYGGTADWDAIARLKEARARDPGARQRRHLGGRRRAADDARDRLRRGGRRAGAAWGGRGCSRDLVAAFEGATGAAPPPALGEVAAIMGRHADAAGRVDRRRVARRVDFRKHVGWYLKGFVGRLRARAGGWPPRSPSPDCGRASPSLILDQPWPEGADGPRGKTNPRDRVHLPAGWLDDPYDLAVPGADAELETSGG